MSFFAEPPFFGRVAACAQRQHGTITRQQLLANGASDQAICTMVVKGVLQRATAGVYLIGGSPPTWHQRLAVAVHRAGPLGLVSHRAASGLWSLDQFRPGHLDVTGPWASARTGTDLRMHRSCDLSTRDRTVVDGLPATTPTRTLIDVARYVGAERLGSMIDDAVRRGLTSYEELGRRHSELARPGRNGIGTMSEALKDRPGGAPVPGSPFEVRVRRLLERAGLPAPEAQHRVRCDDLTYVLDLAWPELLVAVECDGFRFHRTPAQLEWDDHRRTELGRKGWLVHHVTWRQYRRSPDQLAAEVRSTLQRRSG